VVRALERERVDTSYVARRGPRRTSLALLAQLPPDRFPRIFYRDNPADIHLTVDEARRLPLASTSVVLVSGDVFARGTTAQACAWIMCNPPTPGTTVYIDLDLRPENWPSLDAYAAAVRPMAERADVVLGTAEEFAALGGELMLRHGQVIVEKRGEDGAMLIVNGESVSVPADPATIASTVGAGDSFAAGLIAARLRGADWLSAARFGSACAAVTVSRFGCSEGFPTLAEVTADAH
jgi:5-dehydro-2-deoxygluconokinase